MLGSTKDVIEFEHLALMPPTGYFLLSPLADGATVADLVGESVGLDESVLNRGQQRVHLQLQRDV